MCGEKERVGRTRLSEKKAHSTKGRLRKKPPNSSVARSGQWDTAQKKDKESNSKSLEVRTPGKKE